MRPVEAETDYLLCGTRISVQSSDSDLLERVLTFMASTFAFSTAYSSRPSDTIKWMLDTGENELELPGEKPVFDSPTLTVWKSSGGFLLQCGHSTLALDTSAGIAQASIHSSFWESELRAARELFQTAMLMLLHPKEKWGLHAVGLVSDNLGVLLVGDSGAGKTTTALSLIRTGWNYLSDDALCISEQNTGRVVAHAFRRGFAPTDEGWKALGSSTDPADTGQEIAPGKWLVDLDDSHRSQHVDSCVPSIIAFPVISKESETRAARVSPGQGLARMIPQCAGITADRDHSALQMATLGKLAEQAEFYNLHVGRDVFDIPERVSGLLKGLTGP